jgi:hypothetical protein
MKIGKYERHRCKIAVNEDVKAGIMYDMICYETLWFIEDKDGNPIASIGVDDFDTYFNTPHDERKRKIGEFL